MIRNKQQLIKEHIMTSCLIKPAFSYWGLVDRHKDVNVLYFPDIEGGFTEGILPKSAEYLETNQRLRFRYSRAMATNIYADKGREYKYKSILDYLLCTLMTTMRPFCIQYYRNPDESPSLGLVLQDKVLADLDDMLLKNLKFFNTSGTYSYDMEGR